MRPSLEHLATLALPDPVPSVRESPLDASDELDALTGLALKNLRQVLEMKFDPEMPRSIGQKIAAAQTVLNTQVKVDESRLKKRQLDTLPKLLEVIRREEGRMVRTIEGELATA